MLYALGIAAAIIGIAVSIGLHEVGHLVPAKRFGVRVPQYMIGFGPTIFSRIRGETEYGVKAIPLGGYIRMIGMYPPPQGAPQGTVGRGSTGRFAALAESAREAAWEEIRPGDERRVFYRLSVPRKITVMLGGPTMNLLISAALFTVLLVGIGLPGPTPTVAQVAPCVPAYMTSQAAAQEALADPSTVPAQPCTEADERSPAAAAGIVAGETITSISGQPVGAWSDLTVVTRAMPGEQVTLGVTGATGQREVDVVLATAYRPVVDEAGAPTGEVQATGYLGLTPTFEYSPQPLSAVPETMWQVSVRSAQALLMLPVRVVELAGDLFSTEARNPDGPVSVVGIGRISGEVASAEDPVKAKVATFISLMASLNLFLFLFNLLPVLPLDGGHVAGAAWEGVRRRIAYLRGQPDPGPVDVSKAMPIAYAVAVVLIALSSVVILADLIKPISIYG